MTYKEGYKRILSVLNVPGAFDLQTYSVFVLYLITLYNNKGFRESIGSIDEPMTLEWLSLGVCGAVQYDESGRSRIFLEVLEALKTELVPTKYESVSGNQGRFGLLQYWPTSIEETYNVIRSIDDEWFDQHLARLFEDILSWLAESTGKNSSEYIQPSEITKLVTALSGYEGSGSIYNPYAGTASYAIEMRPKKDYVGEEINPMTWSVGALRMMVHGLNPGLFSQHDSIENWSGNDILSGEGKRFDYIVATPPFSMMLHHKQPENFPLHSFRRVEEDFLFRGAMSLKINGTLTGVFPAGIAFRETSTEKNLRKKLVEEGLVSRVILLPANLFYGRGIPSVIIQLRRGDSDGAITMMDASTFFIKEKRRNLLVWEDILRALDDGDADHIRIVQIEEVARKGYSLFPPKYLAEAKAAPEGYKAFKVSDIIVALASSPANEGETYGRILSPANLSKDAFGRRVEVSSLSQGELKPGCRKMTEPFIAVSRSGSLRPTMVNASKESPVFISNNIASFLFKGQEVYGPLFLYEWRRTLDNLPGVSYSINGGSVKDALEMTVYLPKSLDEQQLLFIRLERQDMIARARELGLEGIIASQKIDFVNIVRSRKHDLDNCLGAAKNDFSALSKCLNRVKIDGQDLTNRPLSENVDTTIGEQLEKVKQLLDRMSAQIKHFTDENAFGEGEKVNLKAKLDSIMSHGNYTVVHETDLNDIPHQSGSRFNPGVFVNINSSDLDRVFDNIIRNAEKHGFKNPNSSYTLKLSLSYDYSDNMYVVEFQNNGAPMPKGMDTLRYGIDGEKGKDSDGLGKGGSIVKSIVEHFGGKYEVFNEPDSLFPVGILIKLPRYED